MQTKSNLARVNGIELGYEVFGKGEPPVLLHGGFGSLESSSASSVAESATPDLTAQG